MRFSLGNLLDPPVISADVLFAPIDVLRRVLHEPAGCIRKRSGRLHCLTEGQSEENDTTILPATPPAHLGVSDTILAIREGTAQPVSHKTSALDTVQTGSPKRG